MPWTCLDLTLLVHFSMFATNNFSLNIFASWAQLSELHTCHFLCLDYLTHLIFPLGKVHPPLKVIWNLIFSIRFPPQRLSLKWYFILYSSLFPSCWLSNLFDATLYFWPVTFSNECITTKITLDITRYILFSLISSGYVSFCIP